MSNKTYRIDEAVSGNFTADSRSITFKLEAGDHTPKSADDRLVLEHLVSLGIAKPAEKNAKTQKAAPAESTVSVS